MCTFQLVATRVHVPVIIIARKCGRNMAGKVATPAYVSLCNHNVLVQPVQGKTVASSEAAVKVKNLEHWSLQLTAQHKAKRDLSFISIK